MTANVAQALLPIVYSCSGCSSAAQMANWVALELDRRELAEMSCIAGVGGDVPALVKLAKSGRPIIAIDGCRLRCVAACLARHDVVADVKVNLAELGVQRTLHEDFDHAEARKVLVDVVRRLRTGGGPIERLLHDDHVRLDALLTAAVADQRELDQGAYAEFRRGLLRHIAIEEKILLKDAQRRRGGEPLPMAEQLRIEHSALAALLVPPPDHAIVNELRTILDAHNPREEGPDGMYAAVEALAGEDIVDLLDQIRCAPEVKTAPHLDAPGVYRTAASALTAMSRKRAAGVDASDDPGRTRAP